MKKIIILAAVLISSIHMRGMEQTLIGLSTSLGTVVGNNNLRNIILDYWGGDLNALLRPYIQANDARNTVLSYCDGWHLVQKMWFDRVKNPFKKIIFSPTQLLFSCIDYESKTLRCKDILSNSNITEKHISKENILTAAFSPDGKFLAYGTETGNVELLARNDEKAEDEKVNVSGNNYISVKSWKELSQKLNKAKVTNLSLSFLPNKEYLVGTSEALQNSYVHSWRLTAPHYQHPRIRNAKLAYSGNGMFSAFYNESNNSVDIYKKEKIYSINGIAIQPKEIKFSDDGNWLVMVSSNSFELKIYTRRLNKDKKDEFILHERLELFVLDHVGKLIISHDGSYIAWIQLTKSLNGNKERDRSLVVYKPETKEKKTILIPDDYKFQNELQFTKDDQSLVVGMTKKIEAEHVGPIQFVIGILDLKALKWVAYISNEQMILKQIKAADGHEYNGGYALDPGKIYHPEFPRESQIKAEVDVNELPIALSHDGQYMAIGGVYNNAASILLYKNLK
jgi:WD40 repeat protein